MPYRTPTTHALQALLADVNADLANRSTDIWSPAYGPCPARAEVAEVSDRLRSDGATPWGSAPVEVIWKASQLLSAAVFEYARAAVALMEPPFRVWAPTVEVRAAVEAAAQLYWLLDCAVPDGLARVGRYYTMRLYAARQLEYTYDQVRPDEPLSDFGKSADDIKDEAASLALDSVLNKKQDVIGYQGQKFPPITALVQEIVGDNGAYSMLSGFSHSELWAMLGGYQGQLVSPLGLSPDEHVAESESLVPLVRACLQALFKPLDHASILFGRSALARDLQRLYDQSVDVLRA